MGDPIGIRGIARSLGTAIAIACACGALIGAVLGIWIGQLNGLTAPGELLILTAYLASLYTAVSAAVLIAACPLLLAFGIHPTRRVCVAILLASYVLLNGTTRYISSVQFVSVLPHMSLIGVLDLVVVTTAAIAAGWGVAMHRAAVGLGAAALLILGLELGHQLHEPPALRPLSTLVAEASGGAEPPAVFATKPRVEQLDGVRLAILAVDGLSWDVLAPLLERGECGNFRKLLEGAAFGHLETLFYPRSPVLWEAIATGRTPREHGIGDHSHFKFPGLQGTVRHLPHFRLANSLLGVNRLLIATERIAPWTKVPASAIESRAARFWEIANRSGQSVGIYNWYNTTPVTPVLGFVRGKGGIPPVAFPLELEEGLPKLNKPTPYSGVSWVEEMIPWETAHFEHFLALAKSYDPALVSFYTHFADGVNHLNWKAAAHGDGFFISGLRKPALGPAPAITRVMQFVDEILGEYMGRLPSDATLVVVSDHGFDFRGYEHDNSPAGVLIVRGPAIRSGVFDNASLYDVAPTLLHILGLPVADDMEGAPLPIARSGGELDREPTRVASHGRPSRPLAAERPNAESLEKHEEYLRALGYVN